MQSRFFLATVLFAATSLSAAPRISETAAATIAVNDLRVTDSAVSLTHPRHEVTWTSSGVRFEARRGPSWDWSLASVRLGAAHLDLAREVVPSADLGRLSIDYNRGALIERYLCGSGSVEQQFVLPDRLSSDGEDLVIEGDVRSSGTFATASRGWMWSDGRGVVSLGRITVFDRNGAVLAARMDVTADRVRLTVDGAALISAAYPVTIDPEIGTNDFRISVIGTDGSTASRSFDTAVAYNSVNDEFLVVWSQNHANDMEIYGQRISATNGASIGSNFRISDMGPDGSALYAAVGPAVAYNRINNEYLVLWAGDDNTLPLVDNENEIFGQRINAATGAEIGTNDFRISNMGVDGTISASAFYPKAAWNSTNNEYLVVWYGFEAGDTEIWGQRLTAPGVEVGVQFTLSDIGNAGDMTRSPTGAASVAYNSANNEYLVVWSADDLTTDNELEVFGQRVSAAGAQPGTNDFRISFMGPDLNTSYAGHTPAVTWNSSANEYLVVWTGTDDTAPLVLGENEIFGQRLSGATAAAVGTDFRISNAGTNGDAARDADNPHVSYSAAINEYFVVWQADAGPTDDEKEIWGQRVSSAGAEVGGDVQLSDIGLDGSTLYTPSSQQIAHASAGIALIVWSGDDNTLPLVDNEFEVFGQLFALTKSDFNIDGKSDIVLRNYSTGQNALWLMNGTALTSVVDLPTLANTSYRIEGTADFNADGKPDIVLRNYATGQNALWLMNGTALSSIVDLPALTNTDYHFEGTGDFNADSKPDIILRNILTGQNALWLMNGTAVSSIVDLPLLSNTNYRIESAGDFNADGKPDIVLRNYGTGQNALWLMNGTSLISVVDLPTLANTAYRFDAVADFNGDGKADIVLRNYTTGQNAVWIMNGTSVSSIVDLPALPNINYEINGPR